jgi:hypothetical protein
LVPSLTADFAAVEASAKDDRQDLIRRFEKARHDFYAQMSALERLQFKAGMRLFRATLGKTVRGHGVYPRYDVPFLWALRDLGFATADELAFERNRRGRGWFPVDTAVASNWLESARRRRLVERNTDNSNEWGTTDRGESRIPSVSSVKAYVPIIGVLVAAGEKPMTVDSLTGVRARLASGFGAFLGRSCCSRGLM